MRRWLVALMLGLFAAGCRKQEPEPCTDSQGARAIDAPLLAFLSRSRAAHHAADQAEQSNDLGRAIALLDEIVSGPLPVSGSAPPAEVREVLADTLARLADLQSRTGAFDAAEAKLERGLDLVREPTYFRGHLYEVSGLVWERRARALSQQGDAAGAKSANEKALEALETAMKIQAQVIRDSTERKVEP
jgi:tetratricopeptide (TPR) repeat protein